MRTHWYKAIPKKLGLRPSWLTPLYSAHILTPIAFPRRQIPERTRADRITLLATVVCKNRVATKHSRLRLAGHIGAGNHGSSQSVLGSLTHSDVHFLP